MTTQMENSKMQTKTTPETNLQATIAVDVLLRLILKREDQLAMSHENAHLQKVNALEDALELPVGAILWRPETNSMALQMPDGWYINGRKRNPNDIEGLLPKAYYLGRVPLEETEYAG